MGNKLAKIPHKIESLFTGNLPMFSYKKNKQGVYFECNSLFAYMAGCDFPEDIVGKTDTDLPWKELPKEILEGEKKALALQLTHVTALLPIVDGVLADMFITLSPWLTSDGNSDEGVCGVGFNKRWIKSILETPSKENLLEDEIEILRKENKQRKNLIDAIVSRMPGSLFWKDKEGRYLGCNQFVADMSGFPSPKEIIGTTDYDFPWKSQAKNLQNADQEVMESKKIKTYEEIVKLANGKMATYLSTKAPYYDEHNQVVGIIGTSMDITELKDTQSELEEAKVQAEAANLAKSNFLSACGHELRTPVSYILGVCDYFFKLLEKNQLTMDLIEEHLPLIRQNAKDLDVLIEDVLEYTKLELGRTTLTLAPVNLRETLAALYKQSCAHTNRADMKIDMTYPDSVSSYVLGDQNRIRQVYNNYMNNAFKFSQKNGLVHTTVSEIIHPSTQQHMVKVSVKDNGIGIASDKLDDIWGRFQQVHAKTSDERHGCHKGLGLGLSIVRELVTLMQGEVSVESILGKGSTFSFLLPVWDKNERKSDSEENK